MLSNSSILVTGGTGSFGNAFIPMTLKKYNPRRIVVFSGGAAKDTEGLLDEIREIRDGGGHGSKRRHHH